MSRDHEPAIIPATVEAWVCYVDPYGGRLAASRVVAWACEWTYAGPGEGDRVDLVPIFSVGGCDPSPQQMTHDDEFDLFVDESPTWSYARNMLRSWWQERTPRPRLDEDTIAEIRRDILEEGEVRDYCTPSFRRLADREPPA